MRYDFLKSSSCIFLSLPKTWQVSLP